MPTNITQGNVAKFAVEFLDAGGNLTIPSSATLTVVYIPIGSLAAVSCQIAMIPFGSFFTASWDSTPASLNLASYSITAPNQVNSPAGSGQIRVIDP